MSHVRRTFLVLVALALLAVGLPAAAGEPDSPYGDTYTAEELAALDRALHAANMDRRDLTFKKDLTKGHACLPVVREMLRDPLTIAPRMDALARAAQGEEGGSGLGRTLGAVRRILPDPEAKVAMGSGEVGGATAAEQVRHWEGLVADADDTLQIFLHGPRWARQEGEERTKAHAQRLLLPHEMAWHDVFENPYGDEEKARLEAFLEEQADDWLHARLAELDLAMVLALWQALFGWRVTDLSALPADVFPTDRPYDVPTPYGRIGLGTMGDDVYHGDYAVLIDPGGNDRYVSCRIGAAYGTENRHVGFFADLGGDDVYECGDVNVTLGAAILGIAAFYDLGEGNDRYVGGHCTMGAAMGGVGVFYDDGGSDVYEGKTYTQGAAGFGIGIFYDDAVGEPLDVPTDRETPDPIDIGRYDSDRLSAWANAQAFARCKGIALCVNRRGNDLYEAGGVYLHAPLFSDRYQSFSQGFAIGARNIDYAGGIAMLIDHDGNDRYLGDIYDQGVGYWYGAGLLWDGGGNDTYEMTQYGQGSGIHLAVGGLVDVSGHDTYVMHSGLGQGGSHDYAASILHDRGGNDRYLGNTSCNGSALTNSVGLHIERSGNDVYAGRRKGSINFGRPARGFSSIGVLVDLAGQDDYLGIMADDTLWRHTDIGVGWDRKPPEPEKPSAGGVTPAADQPSGHVEIPEICSYEGDLTQEVFDELWGIAIRWEVGDNRTIVPKARHRLIAFGKDVLPMMDAVVEKGASGLELRAYVAVLKGLREKGDGAEVLAFLKRNLESDVERRMRMGLYLTGELKEETLGEAVVDLLGSGDVGLARRAAGVLKALGSHAGDDVLRGWLKDAQADELVIQSAMGVLLGLGSDAYDDVRPLLDHPMMSVRTALVPLLVKRADVYLDRVRADLTNPDLSTRARRTILEVLIRTVPAPDRSDILALQVLLEHDDWGVRADAVRLIKRWEADEGVDGDAIASLLETLAKRLETETDPYVLFCAHHSG